MQNQAAIALLSDTNKNDYNESHFYCISPIMFRKINEKIPGKNGNERALLLFLIYQEQNGNFHPAEQFILDNCAISHSSYSECRKRLVEKELIEYEPHQYIKILYKNIMA